MLRPGYGVVEVPREHRAAVHGVGEPHGHAIDVAREVAAVVLEEALGRVEEVAGLEQAEHHREERERPAGRRCSAAIRPNTSISDSTVEP